MTPAVIIIQLICFEEI